MFLYGSSHTFTERFAPHCTFDSTLCILAAKLLLVTRPYASTPNEDPLPPWPGTPGTPDPSSGMEVLPDRNKYLPIYHHNITKAILLTRLLLYDLCNFTVMNPRTPIRSLDYDLLPSYYSLF